MWASRWSSAPVPAAAATSSSKNAPRLDAADAPHQLADQPSEGHAVVAVPGPRLPGRRARRHAGRDGRGVGPPAAVPRKQLVGIREADGARLVAEQLAHGRGAPCRGNRTRASTARPRRRGRARPGPPGCARTAWSCPFVDDMMTARVSSLPCPRPPGPAEPVQTSTTHSPSTKAQNAPPPSPRSARRSRSPTATVAPAPSDLGHPLEARRHEAVDSHSDEVTARATPSRRRATSPCATTTR